MVYHNFGLILVALATTSVGYDTIALNKVIDRSCNVVTLQKTKRENVIMTNKTDIEVQK